MFQCQLRRVQENPRRLCPPVQRIPQNRKPAVRRVHPYLVRPPRQRLRLHRSPPLLHSAFFILPSAFPEYCLRRLPPGVDRPAHVPFPRPDKRAPDRKLALSNGPIRQQQVRLPHAAIRELPRKRAIGQLRLRKYDYTGRLLVQPVDDRQLAPPCLPMPQPIINPLARIPARRVRIHPGGLIHHHQVFILEDQARNHGEQGSRLVGGWMLDVGC